MDFSNAIEMIYTVSGLDPSSPFATATKELAHTDGKTTDKDYMEAAGISWEEIEIFAAFLSRVVNFPDDLIAATSYAFAMGVQAGIRATQINELIVGE